MNKNSRIIDITQVFLTEKEVEKFADLIGYKDTARKFTIYDLLQYFIAASVGKWSSFRKGEKAASDFNLERVDHSTFSKKASAVPYELFKKLFHLLLEKCNRKTRRSLNLPKGILAIDSTTITVGEGRLKWAKFHGKRSGVKLHVALDVANNQPVQVKETVALKHDGLVGESLADPNYVLVEDRAYSKIKRFDSFKKDNQSFVVRIKRNVTFFRPKALRRLKTDDSYIIRDITCKLGTKQNRSENRFRIVIFNDDYGNEIRVCTDIMTVSAEAIANAYKERWKIETFFRFIKQNLNATRLFGTTENAVYNQLYIALIAYVILHFLYHNSVSEWKYVKLSQINFIRELIRNELPIEAKMQINRLIKKVKSKAS
jgi:hypothetical protein